MKFIENQISSAMSDIRSRVRGKVSPERTGLNIMSKVDSAKNKKIEINHDDEFDNSGYSTEEDMTQEYKSPSSEYDADPSLSVQYGGYKKPRNTENNNNVVSRSNSDSNTCNNDRFETSQGMIKKTVAKSDWDNDFIKAAIPCLLTLLPIISKENPKASSDLISLKLQLSKQVEDFRYTLLSKQYLPEDVDHMGYMLCSFLDEKLAENGIIFDTSLLVQFYKDAWGGEKCFDYLGEYLEKPNKNKKNLEFYDLFLSMGFLGKYGIIDQGPIMLNNLRSKVKSLLFPKPVTNLTHLLDYEILQRKHFFLTPLKLFLALALAFLLIYLLISLYLHNLSRNLRNEIAAWQPPVLATIRETPPPELSKILDEGWLQIREHPLGWLLIFTSDGAFNVGSAELTEEFKSKKNLERLGNALANYPGDLVVIGHTDNTQYRKGTGSNLQLSIGRAKTVENELRNGTSINKLNQRKISSEGKGESEPIASNATAEGRTKNRRVDVLWLIGRKDKNEVLGILNKNNEDLVKDQEVY